jgi:hypothetical protein
MYSLGAKILAGVVTICIIIGIINSVYMVVIGIILGVRPRQIFQAILEMVLQLIFVICVISIAFLQ